MPITLNDISKATGFARTTISYVLNNNLKIGISEDTRELILSVAKDMGYRSNMQAKALRTGKTGLIALVGTNLKVELQIHCAILMDELIREQEYRGLILTATSGKEKVPSFKLAIEKCIGRNVEGIIYMSEEKDDKDILVDAVKNGIKVVLFRPIEGFEVDSVSIDRHHGSYIAAKHFIDLGHRNIGIVAASMFNMGEKWGGYSKALIEAGFDPKENLELYDVDDDQEAGYYGTKILMKKKPHMTAIICDCDATAIGSMKALNELGYKIPYDVSVIGYDDVSVSKYSLTSLTTIHQPKNEQGRKAVELMFERLSSSNNGFDTQNIIFKPSLVVRSSSCPARN